jgi:NADH:ubiquinone oxidoreductase subunit F (NADH-binding)
MSLPRLLAGTRRGQPLSTGDHLAVHGPMPRGDVALLERVGAAGLRGRGGASFPTAVKLRSVAEQPGRRFVLVNGAEGEPMSAKDRVLAQLAPHLVLDGALAAAEMVGAQRIVVAVRDDAAPAIAALRGASAERSLGRRVSVRPVPSAYLAGEESALIRHLNGGPLQPQLVPPLPFERGLKRQPTLVVNPETVAHVALIARRGPGWFRELGTEDQPGSALVTVSGAVARPGVQEIGCGTSLSSVLAHAGGASEPLRAVLVGGFHGTWIAAEEIPSLTLDDRGLATHGASLAAGVIVALGESACPVQELAQTMRWLAAESAGQCGPCANGLPALAEMTSAIAAGAAPADALGRLDRWSAQIVQRGACHLPDGAVRFLASGRRVFATELEEHARLGPCSACQRLTTLTTGSSAGRIAA